VSDLDDPAAARRRWNLSALVLIAATATALAPALGCGFVWDDLSLVVDNRLVDDWGNLGRVWTTDLWASSGVDGRVSGYYRPLQLVSLMVDRSVWGLSPGGHHLSSLLWHLLAVGALLALLRQLVSPAAALLGAALFAVHPLQAETVVWISARSGSMAAAMGLAGLALLAPKDAGRWRLLGGGALLFGGMLCKEHAVFAPVLLVLLDAARGGVSGRWRHLVAFGGIGLALALRMAVGVGASMPAGVAEVSLVEAVARVGGHTGWQLAVPWPLTTRRHLGFSPFPAWQLAIGWLVLGAGVAAAWRWGGRLGLAGIAFAALAFAPSILAILDQQLFGDRYLYLPMAGLGIAAAAAVDRLGRRALWLGLLAVPALAITGARVPDWDSDLTLDCAAAEAEPENAYAAGACGGRLVAAGYVDEGMAKLEEAVTSDRPPAAACHALVRVPLQAGDTPRARRAVEQVRAGCPETGTLLELIRAVEGGGGG